MKEVASTSAGKAEPNLTEVIFTSASKPSVVRRVGCPLRRTTADWTCLFRSFANANRHNHLAGPNLSGASPENSSHQSICHQNVKSATGRDDSSADILNLASCATLCSSTFSIVPGAFLPVEWNRESPLYWRHW